MLLYMDDDCTNGVLALAKFVAPGDPSADQLIILNQYR
jgi:hypothetical protein